MFVYFQDGVFTWSESVTTPPVGKLDLKNLQGIEYDENDETTCKFGITTTTKRYNFWTRNAQDCLLWVRTLKKAAGNTKVSAGGPAADGALPRITWFWAAAQAGFGSAVNTSMLF